MSNHNTYNSVDTKATVKTYNSPGTEDTYDGAQITSSGSESAGVPRKIPRGTKRPGRLAR